MLKFNLHYGVLKEWKFIPAMAFRGGTFGRRLELHDVVKVETP